LILWFDDEREWMAGHEAALKQAGFTVLFTETLNEAWACYNAEHDRIELLIVDLMAPIPRRPIKGFDIARMANGHRVGAELLRRVNDTGGESIPKIVLTNNDDYAFHGELQKWPGVIMCREKGHFLPSELVAVVVGVLR
jgi:CheY-like chemotaxis protein